MEIFVRSQVPVESVGLNEESETLTQPDPSPLGSRQLSLSCLDHA